MKLKSQIMDEASFNRTLVRIAHQIIEKNNGIENLCLIGIKTRGVPMANIIADNIQKIENRTVKTGILDITLYRDDLSIVNIDPIVNKTDIPFDITGMNVVLIDDVLFTGRTARAAMDAVTKLGRPSSIQLAVLVDRGHRELPIRADFVGKNLPTSKNEIVCVHFNATDQKQNVELYEK